MNCPCDLTNRYLDASDVALRLERACHLDTEVNVHRLIPTFWVVIQKQVVAGFQFASSFQKRPHLIESRLPCSGNISDGHRSPDCCHQLCFCSLHHNIIFHGHDPSRTRTQPIASAWEAWSICPKGPHATAHQEKARMLRVADIGYFVLQAVDVKRQMTPSSASRSTSLWLRPSSSVSTYMLSSP